MKLWKVVACLPFVFASATVQAEPDPEAVQDILSKNSCLACHAVDKKVVGPSYQDVADKYKDEDDAAETLAKHIREGSSGVWGQVRSEEHTSELQSRFDLVCRLLLEKKNGIVDRRSD